MNKNLRPAALPIYAIILLTLSCVAVSKPMPPVLVGTPSGTTHSGAGVVYNNPIQDPMWLATSSAVPARGNGRMFEVCTGCEHTDLDTVPWHTLGPGDTVNIYKREAPYRWRIFLGQSGTQELPIIINGVTDAQGNRPVFDISDPTRYVEVGREWGNDGQYHLAQYGGIVFSYSRDGASYTDIPEWIQLKNLEIRGGGSGGASGIYAQMARNILIEGCVIHDNGNGIFVNSGNLTAISTNWTIRGNHIFGNGTLESYRQHNLYVQSTGKNMYEYNLFGEIREGSFGGVLKDRSSGVTIRKNVIIGSARIIDLVEAQGSQDIVMETPALEADYRNALIEDNLILSNENGNIHFGFDSGSNHPTDPELYNTSGPANNKPLARNGLLTFRRNTYVYVSNYTKTRIFDLGGSGSNSSKYPGRIELSDNTIYASGTGTFGWLKNEGEIIFSGGNQVFGTPYTDLTEAATGTSAATRQGEVQTQPQVEPTALLVSFPFYKMP